MKNLEKTGKGKSLVHCRGYSEQANIASKSPKNREMQTHRKVLENDKRLNPKRHKDVPVQNLMQRFRDDLTRTPSVKFWSLF